MKNKRNELKQNGSGKCFPKEFHKPTQTLLLISMGNLSFFPPIPRRGKQKINRYQPQVIKQECITIEAVKRTVKTANS